jgi:OOP family OmpA-OmpF porin
MTFSGGEFPHARRAFRIAGLVLVTTLPASALDLVWPNGSERVWSDQRIVSGYPRATAPFDGSTVPTETLAGELVEAIWHVTGAPRDPAGLAQWLTRQLRAQGYDIRFACADRTCGGFDFRFALPIAPEPEMHVDLGDFQYIVATIGPRPAPTETVILTLSQGGQTGYAHLVRLRPQDASAEPTPRMSEASATAPPADPGDAADAADVETLIADLLRDGSRALDDLNFETGASGLSGARYDSLVILAEFLAQDASRRVALVGHTDMEGTLDANIDLSRARAEAVRRYLVEELGVRPDQVQAHGVGYLAPRAANSTAEGREANRRVEVILIPG